MARVEHRIALGDDAAEAGSRPASTSAATIGRPDSSANAWRARPGGSVSAPVTRISPRL
jgi:hypothetical protein